MDLLTMLWAHADPQMQETLGKTITAGPPDHLLAHIENVEERQKSRDRRIFDRLIVLQRLGDPILTAELATEAQRLRELYPNWEAAEGEEAHFSSWIETRTGIDTRYDIEDLKDFTNEELIEVLIREVEMREGMLESWRLLMDTEPTRGVELLEMLSRREAPMPADVWSEGLRGVRNSAKQPELRDRLVRMLRTLPRVLFNDPEISRATSDFLEEAATSRPSPTRDDEFLNLYDQALTAVENDPSNSDQPDQKDWVSLAINRSMGRVATTFFALLFGRELKVGAGLPEDLKPRINALIAPNRADHRPARVIAASRLSYLYAVDPEWAQANLIPIFDWSNEREALAAWQGYAWQPRIDYKLWLALKPYFLPMFTPDRLHQLGNLRRNFAQMLMLIGIEFGIDEFPRDPAREAIRVMPDSMKADAISWIVSYLEQREKGTDDNQKEASLGVDELWTKRVWPWLERVWPADPELRSQNTAEQFAHVAIATDASFPNAVAALLPQMIPVNAFYVIHQLQGSSHPTEHPEATLHLIDAIVDPEGLGFGKKDLREILNRMREADGGVADILAFRRWNERLLTLNI